MASGETKLTLMRAAEKLFEERSIDTVTLKEINELANQRNTSAIQYHFGGKRELVEAILMRHADPIQHEWYEIFKDPNPALSLRDVITALVRSIVAKIDDPDGGIAYIRICAQLSVHPTIPLVLTSVASTPGAIVLGERIYERLDTPGRLRFFRGARLAGAIYLALNDYLIFREREGVPTRELFVEDLIDCIVGMVSAEPSAITRAKL